MKAVRKTQQRMLVAAAISSLFALEEQIAQAADIRVEVTGSNIKRVEGEGALPVQVINRDDILRSGSTNAMELMNLISANNSLGNVSLPNIIGAATFSNQTASLAVSAATPRSCSSTASGSGPSQVASRQRRA